jgi:hypothetical protein
MNLTTTILMNLLGGLLGGVMGYLLAKALRPRAKTAVRRLAATPKPADYASARVVDGYLTLIAIAACPTDRFQLEDAIGPQGAATAQITLTIRLRDQAGPEADHAALVLTLTPGKGIVDADVTGGRTSEDELERLASGSRGPVLGPEHELILTPPAATLIGRLV